MNTLSGPAGARIRPVVLLCSSRSSQHITPRHITNHLFRCTLHDAAKSHQRHKISTVFLHQQGRRYSTDAKVSDPLHILFCGSDEFSCASLEALHAEHVRNPDLIRSIDVVVRPGKRTGRGYKIVRDPPVRSLANSLGLQIHERDTFTGWDMPTKTNLIIAVSFGLFVPPRLLRTAKYGGLNLHPSLLPDLRGPAPLQHTLLAGRTATGVSLQTLDHAAFDHGVVLAQTPQDALRIPQSCTTVAALQALVTPAATRLLIEGLRKGLHVPPHESVVAEANASLNSEGATDEKPLVHAPKITKGDRQLTLAILQECDSEERKVKGKDNETGKEVSRPGTLARRQAAIGPLFFLSRDHKGRQKRIILEAIAEEPVTSPSISSHPSMMSFANSSERENSSPHIQRYRIPFEEEQETQQEQTASEKENTNLVFWEPIDSPSSPSTPSTVVAPREECDDTLYLGNHRILSLKVEGEKAKLPRQALHNFFI
ncbi:formyl transferase [Xylaria arbuscula]|nr:formyl transferase [Xylaria arbuscula]